MALSSYNGFTGERRLEIDKLVKAAYRDGSLERPAACMACGQDQGPIIGHLEDYDRWRDATIPLCQRCHLMLHCRWRAPAAWHRYRELVRMGYRFAPATGHFTQIVPQFVALMAAQRAFEAGEPGACPSDVPLALPYTQHARPARAILDEIEAGLHDPRRARNAGARSE